MGSALPVAMAAWPGRATAGILPPKHPVTGPALAVLVDAALPPARAFAARAAQLGVPVLALPDGDPTGAWLTLLRPAWQRGPARVVGLTAPATLFCLEQLALAHGLRVTFHAEHRLGHDRAATHALQRAAPGHGAHAALARGGAQWPARLAHSLLSPPPRPRRPFPGAVQAASGVPGRSLAGLPPALADGERLLASWIIDA